MVIALVDVQRTYARKKNLRHLGGFLKTLKKMTLGDTIGPALVLMMDQIFHFFSDYST